MSAKAESLKGRASVRRRKTGSSFRQAAQSGEAADPGNLENTPPSIRSLRELIDVEEHDTVDGVEAVEVLDSSPTPPDAVSGLPSWTSLSVPQARKGAIINGQRRYNIPVSADTVNLINSRDLLLVSEGWPRINRNMLVEASICVMVQEPALWIERCEAEGIIHSTKSIQARISEDLYLSVQKLAYLETEGGTLRRVSVGPPLHEIIRAILSSES